MVARCCAVAGVGCMTDGVLELMGAGRWWNVGVVVMVVGVAMTLDRSIAAVNNWGRWWWDVVRQRPLTKLFFCDVRMRRHIRQSSEGVLAGVVVNI